MRIRTLIPAVMLAVSAVLVAGGASADVAGAQDFVQREHGNIKKLVESNAPSDQVRRAIDGMVDYDELTARTLGEPCPLQAPGCKSLRGKVTDDEYRQINTLLRKLVEKNYHKNLDKTREYDVAYKGAREAADNLAKVRTEAKNKTKPRDPAVQVDYVIIEKDGKYKVCDIVTEGSSMTKNYYDQFAKMLNNPAQGPKYLIEKLEKKVNSKKK
jgi:phospholipid transport system substrate-binding protein